jgi:hypothetical protein
VRDRREGESGYEEDFTMHEEKEGQGEDGVGTSA